MVDFLYAIVWIYYILFLFVFSQIISSRWKFEQLAKERLASLLALCQKYVLLVLVAILLLLILVCQDVKVVLHELKLAHIDKLKVTLFYIRIIVLDSTRKYLPFYGAGLIEIARFLGGNRKHCYIWIHSIYFLYSVNFPLVRYHERSNCGGK